MHYVTLKPDQKFTVGKIVCVGRNYVKHIEEMVAERTKEPVLFLKPPTALANNPEQIELPSFSNEIHHEVELALLVGRTAKKADAADWRQYIAGVGLALDLTARDVQARAKEKGLPWAVAKGFDQSCPVTDFVPLDDAGDIHKKELILTVNEEKRQHGNTAHMIFTAGILLAYISSVFTLEAGDLILTGTPAGVGQLRPGDRVQAELRGIAGLDFRITG